MKINSTSPSTSLQLAPLKAQVQGIGQLSKEISIENAKVSAEGRADSVEIGTPTPPPAAYPRPNSPLAPGGVPNVHHVVRGGAKPMPPPGTPFSAAAGVDKLDAAQGIPHGQMRATTAAQIRERGGSVEVLPEPTKAGKVNFRHVEVVEGETGAFGKIEPNPVPKEQRIA